jgi:hypothetical protein
MYFCPLDIISNPYIWEYFVMMIICNLLEKYFKFYNSYEMLSIMLAYKKINK